MDYSSNPQFRILFGERVKQGRLAANLTQEMLASKLGYKHKTSISKIEKGKAEVSQTVVMQIADALGVDVPYLMGKEKEPTFNHVPTITAKKSKVNDLKNDELKLLEAWNKATDDDKFAVYAILRKYGMPQPILEDTTVSSVS